jgi:hypothetical protein
MSAYSSPLVRPNTIESTAGTGYRLPADEDEFIEENFWTGAKELPSFSDLFSGPQFFSDVPKGIPEKEVDRVNGYLSQDESIHSLIVQKATSLAATFTSFTQLQARIKIMLHDWHSNSKLPQYLERKLYHLLTYSSFKEETKLQVRRLIFDDELESLVEKCVLFHSKFHIRDLPLRILPQIKNIWKHTKLPISVIQSLLLMEYNRILAEWNNRTEIHRKKQEEEREQQIQLKKLKRAESKREEARNGVSGTVNTTNKNSQAEAELESKTSEPKPLSEKIISDIKIQHAKEVQRLEAERESARSKSHDRKKEDNESHPSPESKGHGSSQSKVKLSPDPSTRSFPEDKGRNEHQSNVTQRSPESNPRKVADIKVHRTQETKPCDLPEGSDKKVKQESLTDAKSKTKLDCRGDPPPYPFSNPRGYRPQRPQRPPISISSPPNFPIAPSRSSSISSSPNIPLLPLRSPSLPISASPIDAESVEPKLEQLKRCPSLEIKETQPDADDFLEPKISNAFMKLKEAQEEELTLLSKGTSSALPPARYPAKGPAKESSSIKPAISSAGKQSHSKPTSGQAKPSGQITNGTKVAPAHPLRTTASVSQSKPVAPNRQIPNANPIKLSSIALQNSAVQGIKQAEARKASNSEDSSHVEKHVAFAESDPGASGPVQGNSSGAGAPSTVPKATLQENPKVKLTGHDQADPAVSIETAGTSNPPQPQSSSHPPTPTTPSPTVSSPLSPESESSQPASPRSGSSRNSMKPPVPPRKRSQPDISHPIQPKTLTLAAESLAKQQAVDQILKEKVVAQQDSESEKVPESPQILTFTRKELDEIVEQLIMKRKES